MGLSYITNDKNNPVLTSNKDDTLVKIPFRNGYFASINGGSGYSSFNDGGYVLNEDGTGTVLYVNVVSGLGNGVVIRIPFYGRVFGIRFLRNSSTCDFSVMIDGVAYSIKGQHTYYNNGGTNTFSDGESLVIIADDLSNTVHYAEIVVVEPSTGTNIVYLLGLLLERRAGYSEKPRANILASSGVTPTSSTAIPRGTDTSTNAVRNIRKIMYVNTTASAITISIYNNTTLIWQKSVSANDTVEFDTGGALAPIGIGTNFKHMASATGLNYSVFGGI